MLVDRQLIHQAVLNSAAECERVYRPGRTNHAQAAPQRRIRDDFRGGFGTGYSRVDQKKIFQLFFTTRPGGTGIGLANTFRFVQLHNGRIDFESEPGRGTTFRLDLPVAHLAEVHTGKGRDLSQPFAARETVMPSYSKFITPAAVLLTAGISLMTGGCLPKKVQAAAPTIAPPAPRNGASNDDGSGYGCVASVGCRCGCSHASGRGNCAAFGSYSSYCSGPRAA